MTGNDYQQATQRTWHVPDIPYGDLITGALGISGEGGEVADHVKKFIAQGHELSREHVAEELGDVLYYVAVTAKAVGYTLDEVMSMNLNKLWRRYPDGFSVDRSVNRDA